MKGKILISSLLLAMCVSYSAYAAELTVENCVMDYNTDSYNMDVHHSGDEIRPVTVNVKNTATNKSSYFSEFLTNEAGNISLKIPMNSAANVSGEYTIRISGADISEPCDITVVYVNKSDAADIISAIAENKSDLADYIRNNIYSLGLDTNIKTMWDNIGKNGQDTIVKAVAGKRFSDIDEAGKAFSHAICTMRINSADKTNIVSVLDECAGYIGIDVSEGSYYSQLKNKDSVHSAVLGKGFSLAVNNDNGVRAAFKTAVALSWINEVQLSERDKIEAVITDSNEYLMLPLNGDYASLSASVQKRVLMDIIDYRPYSDKTALQSAFDKCLKKYSLSNAGNSSNGGGGGSGGGGGVTAVKPVQNVPDMILPVSTQSTEISEEENTESFTDIENHWARPYIEGLLEKDIVSGTDGSHFEPDRQIRREEVVKIIVRAMNMAAVNAVSVYEDVKADGWYYSYIVAAEKNGLVSGMSDTEFGIGRNIIRQDLAVLVARMLSMNGIMLDSEFHEVFEDEASISDYAKDAVSALKNLGVVSGDDMNCFNPKSEATRAEVARMIAETIKLMDSEE